MDLCVDRIKKVGEMITEDGGNIPDVDFCVYRLSDSHFEENRFNFDPSKSEKESVAHSGNILRSRASPELSTKMRKLKSYRILVEKRLRSVLHV